MEHVAALVLKPLREQVYEYLRQEMNTGGLQPGAKLDVNDLATRLGVSRTPLREALLQLQAEGFVTILPRRGVSLNALTLEDIRHLYEVIGALEGAALISVFDRLTPEDVAAFRRLNAEMREAIEDADFDRYYDRNLVFHEVFLGRCDNQWLARIVRTLKQRLYDWPRRGGFVQEWELASIGEHAAFVDLVERGDARAAADHLRDVHWSFRVQEPFIHRYYFASRKANGG